MHTKLFICLCVTLFICDFASATESVEDRFDNETLKQIEEFRQGWFPREGRNSKTIPEFKPSKIQLEFWNNPGRRNGSNSGGPRGRNTQRCIPPNLPNQWWTQPMERKEYRQLTPGERGCFHAAVNSMKTNMIGQRSEYDMFVEFHQSRNSPGAHFGPAFLPWHREFLFRFELALQIHCPTCTLPYWDSRLDQGLPNPQDSIIWDSDFLGNSQGEVITGPFTNWTVIPRCRRGEPPGIVRNEGPRRQNTALFEDRDLQLVRSKNSYEDLTIPNTFEITHGGPHVYVGGHMVDIICSPSDPTFFLHHAMVDHIWEDFRQNHQTTTRSEEYPEPDDLNLIGGRVHEKYAEMRPFTWMENWNGLSDFYENYFIYSAFQERCQTSSNCQSSYLWCHRNRCTSKVRRGGDCTGFPQTTEPCQCGVCTNGRCPSDC